MVNQVAKGISKLSQYCSDLFVPRDHQVLEITRDYWRLLATPLPALAKSSLLWGVSFLKRNEAEQEVGKLKEGRMKEEEGKLSIEREKAAIPAGSLLRYLYHLTSTVQFVTNMVKCTEKRNLASDNDSLVQVTVIVCDFILHSTFSPLHHSFSIYPPPITPSLSSPHRIQTLSQRKRRLLQWQRPLKRRSLKEKCR